MVKSKKKVRDVEKVSEVSNALDEKGIGEVGCGKWN